MSRSSNQLRNHDHDYDVGSNSRATSDTRDNWRRTPNSCTHTWQPSGNVWSHPRRRRPPRWRLIGACFSLDVFPQAEGMTVLATRRKSAPVSDACGLDWHRARCRLPFRQRGDRPRLRGLPVLAARSSHRAAPLAGVAAKAGRELQVRVPLSRRLHRVVPSRRSNPSTSSKPLSLPFVLASLFSFSFFFSFIYFCATLRLCL